MDYTASVTNSEIDVDQIRTILVQGDSTYPHIQFVLDPSLSGLSWKVRGYYRDFNIAVISDEITPTETETDVTVDWYVSTDFTTYYGEMQLVLVGTDALGETVVKALGNVLIGRDFSISTTQVITQNLFEQLMAQLTSACLKIDQTFPQRFVGGIPKLAADREISDDNDLVDKKHVADVVATVTADDFNHNDLANKQGGATNEYYHMTAAEKTKLDDLDVPGAISTHNADAGAHAGLFGITVPVGIIGDGVYDNTTAIQDALNQKGHIIIIEPGTYITGRLEIDDDTTFELMSGVTLKKKDGTNDHLIINKAHTTGVRNKNICLRGGTWDMNYANNTAAGSYALGTYPGIGILLHKIDGLKIFDIEEIGNEYKYCYLIVDCTNIECANINFDNSSDGLHFQPPIYNCVIRNITGHTGDDLIAFTAGDYIRFAIGRTGNFENVTIDNIHTTSSVEHVRLTGCGSDGNSIFRNFNISNLSGVVTSRSVCVLHRDNVDGNVDLLNTTVKNLVIENISPTFTRVSRSFIELGCKGDVTIRNCALFDQSYKYTFLFVNGDTADQIVIDNVNGVLATDMLEYLINMNSTGGAKKISLRDTSIYAPALNTSTAVFSLYGAANLLNISNCKINVPCSVVGIGDAGATGAFVAIENSQITGRLIVGVTSATIRFSMSNSQITSTFKFTWLSSTTNLIVSSSNSNAEISTNTVGTAKLSINGSTLTWNNLLSLLTPQAGDMLRCVYASEPLGTGLFYYTGSAWTKIA